MQTGLTFDDVLLVPGYTGSLSRSEVETTVKFGPFEFRIPLISSNMDTVTSATMARKMVELGGFGILHRFMSIEDNVKMYLEAAMGGCPVGVSVGADFKEDERAAKLIEAGARIVCVDVAHAHSKLAGRMVKELRKNYLKDIFIIAGNVATYAGADYLSSCGADAIKVGIGPGSACTTRIKTGCGVPQLTAIMECQRVRCKIIADGGIRYAGDVVKALAAGADMVMIGRMFAGTDESPGDIHTVNGVKMKTYRGMASKEVQGHIPNWKTDEGVALAVPYVGSVHNVVQDMVGGLRSGMTYCGAATLEELKRRAQFIAITNAGFIEGTPHGRRIK